MIRPFFKRYPVIFVVVVVEDIFCAKDWLRVVCDGGDESKDIFEELRVKSSGNFSVDDKTKPLGRL